jgi:hypothetical protein
MNELVVERQINISLRIREFLIEKPIRVKEENKQHYFIISLMTYIGIITHAFFLPLFWVIGVKQLAYFNVLSVFLWALAIILNRRGFHFVSFTIGMIEILLHQMLCVYFIGWGAGFQYYILLCPIGVYLLPHGQIDSIWKHNRKKLTLFFSDIKDFTSITDTMEPEDMAKVLNEYLTEMNTKVLSHR